MEFGPNIFIAEGPTITAAAGFHYPTRMVVIKLVNSDLVLWSPTALTDTLLFSIDALGTVKHLVAPNSLHHTYLGDWQRAFPGSKVYASPGLRGKRPDIMFDADFTDGRIEAWTDEIDHAVMWGNRITTEVVFFHRQSRTVIFTDLIQQLPRGWFKGWRAMVAGLT